MVGELRPQRKLESLSDHLPRILTSRRVIEKINRAHENCYNQIAPSAVTVIPYKRGLDEMGERVIEEAGIGSGFIIASNEKTFTIATARHVVEPAFSRMENGASYLEVQTSGVVKGKQEPQEPVRYSVRSVYMSEVHDLAFVEIDRSEHPELDLPRLRLGNSRKLHAGHEVMPIGSPYGLFTSIAVGIVSQDNLADIPSTKPEGYRQISNVKPGNSGGAVVDTEVRKNPPVVGVAIAQVRGDSNTGFMIPVEALIADFEKYQLWVASMNPEPNNVPEAA